MRRLFVFTVLRQRRPPGPNTEPSSMQVTSEAKTPSIIPCSNTKKLNIQSLLRLEIGVRGVLGYDFGRSCVSNLEQRGGVGLNQLFQGLWPVVADYTMISCFSYIFFFLTSNFFVLGYEYGWSRVFNRKRSTGSGPTKFSNAVP